MFSTNKKQIIALLLLLFCGGLFYGLLRINQAGACQLIPRKVLFDSIYQKIEPTVSPDGNYIAYLASYNGYMNLYLRKITEKNYELITKLDNDINSYMWTFDSEQLLYISENETSLKGYSVVDGSTQDYIDSKNQLYFPYYNKLNPRHIIIGMSSEYSPWFDFYDLDLDTKNLKILNEKTNKMTKWIPDIHNVIRGKIELLQEGGAELFVRNSVDDSWRLLLKTNNDWSGIAFFSYDGNFIYYFADLQNADKRTFIKIDVNDGTITEMASDSEYDIEGNYLFDPNTFEPPAIMYMKDHATWIFFDKDIEDIFKIFETIDHGDIHVRSRSLDENIWILGFKKDTGQVSYWLYDKKDNKSEFLFDQNQALKKYKLSPTQPITFHARDGLLLHGYFTHPKCNKQNRVPMVLLVQEDSWMRVTNDFNPVVQWLANRGYAVLQVNTRGTQGYGKKFLDAGSRQWGRLLQNDLTDAVQWAIDNYAIDSKKIGIFGTAYGGYAALMGAITTPNLFACAVYVSGPVDLATYLKTFTPYWKNIFYTRVGNPETEEEFIQSISPLYNIDAIKIPILIEQGANDLHVLQSESDQIVEAMKAKGVDVEYLLFSDEKYGFTKHENKLKFYQTAEKFLAKHLGGAYEA